MIYPQFVANGHPIVISPSVPSDVLFCFNSPLIPHTPSSPHSAHPPYVLICVPEHDTHNALCVYLHYMNCVV